MRKSDREITDFESIVKLIESCDTLRLGFSDEGVPYIVPLSFGFEAKDGELLFYVHGAKTGRRHELAAKNSRVCVEADICKGFVDLGHGSITADYASFIGEGEISTVTGDEAKHGLTLLVKHCGFDELGCNDAVIAATEVEKIVVRDFTAKRRFS